MYHLSTVKNVDTNFVILVNGPGHNVLVLCNRTMISRYVSGVHPTLRNQPCATIAMRMNRALAEQEHTEQISHRYLRARLVRYAFLRYL